MELLAEEPLSYRDAIRELAALSSLAAGGADIQDVARGLAEVLGRMLPVEFVFVRLLGLAHGGAHEAGQSGQGPINGANPRDRRCRRPGPRPGRDCQLPFRQLGVCSNHRQSRRRRRVRLCVVPIHGSCGVVAAGSLQPDFPTPNDLLLMHVGANQAALVREHRRSEESLREANRRKDEFLATVAHELRNPLAPIRNAVQILHSKELAEAEAQWARDVIDRQVQYMTRLVDDLFDLSRITRGKLTVRKQRIELRSVVDSAVESSRPNIEMWGHLLTITLPPEPIYLEADPTRLDQVLLNLLNNAAKYTPQGGHIWLSAQIEGEGKGEGEGEGEVVIRVRDTGIGIRADMLPRIFEMFTQVDRSLGRSQEGLGIGLALVQRLVALHGGTIKAQSPGAGQGSEFIVRLPLGHSAKPDKEKEREWDMQRREESAGGPSSYRILVVDDNRDAANCLAKLLRKSHNDVQTAYDGLEAVEAAAQFRPDLVLMDIGLPRLDGYEAASRIREQPAADAIVLIAVTGWGQEEDRRLSREAGFDYHLIKPIEPAMLQTLLSRLQAPRPPR